MCQPLKNQVAWEKSRHFATPPLVPTSFCGETRGGVANIGYFVRLRKRLTVIYLFFFNICLYFQAYSLKCNLCFSVESWDDCKNTTEETTCMDGFDRCLTQEVKSESPQKTDKFFLKGCAISSLCSLGSKNCRPTDPSAKITKCEVDCCKGDLCNAADKGADNGAKLPIVSAIMLLACAFAAFPR